MRAKLASVSVDLDEVPEYLAIHGISPLSDDAEARHAVYDRALGRILAWAASQSIPITFFAIGKDVARQKNAIALRFAVERGHSVESHSLSHRYDLSRLPRDLIEKEVAGAMAILREATGTMPQGFRAPGYTVSETLFDVLEDAGVSFDSSVFPSPIYWCSKAAVLGWMWLQGRASSSILDTPSVLRAPRQPYMPAQPYYRSASIKNGWRRRSFIELPILATPLLGFPVIGTSIGKVGVRGAGLLGRLASQEAFVNLELHGMDFLEASDVVGAWAPKSSTKVRSATAREPMDRAPFTSAAALSQQQPELRTPLFSRLDRLDRFVAEVRKQGFAFVALHEAAAEFASRGTALGA